MKSKRLLAFILCITLLLLVGCSATNENDGASQQQKGEPIVKYKDVTLDKHDIEKKMNYYLTQQNMTIEDLSEGSDADIWERFKHDIIFELSMFQIALEQATELGLDKLTTAEQQNIDEAYEIGVNTAKKAAKEMAAAAQQKDSSIDYNVEFNRQLEDYFFLHGYDFVTYKEELISELIVSKVKDYYTKDITVTDEDVREKYDYELNIQTNNIKQQPSSIEQHLIFGSEILYYPEGYMYVKHILISFDTSTRGSAAIAYVNGNISEYNKILSEALPSVQPKIEEIQSKLDSGEDFTKLIKQYSDDKTLNEEPYETDGFLIGPYTQFDITEYLDALQTLKNAGDISKPVPTYLGVYIIQCVKPLGGPVPFEEVKDKLKKTMTEQRKAYEWSTLGETWIEQAEKDGTLKTYQDRI